MSRQYEAVMILPSQFAGEKLEEVKKNFADQVQKQGGSVTASHEVGRRPFGYTIKKQKEGNYFVIDFTLDPLKVVELKRTLALTEDILRVSILTKQNIPAPKAPSQPTQRPVKPMSAPRAS